MIIEIDELEKYDIETVRYESDKEGFNHINRLLAEYNEGKNKFDEIGTLFLGKPVIKAEQVDFDKFLMEKGEKIYEPLNLST